MSWQEWKNAFNVRNIWWGGGGETGSLCTPTSKTLGRGHERGHITWSLIYYVHALNTLQNYKHIICYRSTWYLVWRIHTARVHAEFSGNETKLSLGRIIHYWFDFQETQSVLRWGAHATAAKAVMTYTIYRYYTGILYYTIPITDNL